MTEQKRDRVRQVAVAVGAFAAIVGAAWGSGAFGGTPMAQAADGALAPDATLLGAATPAFQIWSVIYLGLVLFAIVQALPSRANLELYRSTAWWILASMILNAVWIAVVQAGWLVVSAPVLVAIVAVLWVTATRAAAATDGGHLDRATTHITVGLYLGWAAVATAANIAAIARPIGTAWALVSIAVVLAVVGYAVLRVASRAIGVSIALASAWGLTWIGIARLDAPHNSAVEIVAFVAAGLALLLAAWKLSRRSASALA